MVGENQQFSSFKCQYLENGSRYGQSYYWWLIGSRISAFDWHQDRWHRMTLNCCKVKFCRDFAWFCEFRRQQRLNEWRSSNRLKLNAEKTQFTCLGTRYQLAKIDGSNLLVNGSAVDLLRAVTCLGVTLDQELTFADHIRRLTGRCFHSLRQLRSIRRYCRPLPSSLWVLNAAARL